MTFAACPDSELLAACAEGRLRGDERERVLRHLTTCHDCYTVFTEALHLFDELPTLVAETAESRVPLASLPARQQPVKPSPAEPAAPRSHDGSTPAAVPATPTPSSLGQPDAADTAKPDNRGGEPRDNVVPFDRRRRRRVATVALPLAAVAALTVVVMQQHPPQAPISSPVTMAQAPSPEPTPTATPTSAPLPVNVARLVEQRDWMWDRAASGPGLGGATHVRICRLVGVTAVDLDVAQRADTNAISERLDKTRTILLEASAKPQLVEIYTRAAAEAERDALRGVASVESATALCDPDAVLAGRTLEWLRLATRTRNRSALEHPDVVAGLAAAQRSGTATEQRQLDAFLRRWPFPDADQRSWGHLAVLAQETMEVWLP